MEHFNIQIEVLKVPVSLFRLENEQSFLWQISTSHDKKGEKFITEAKAIRVLKLKTEKLFCVLFAKVPSLVFVSLQVDVVPTRSIRE